MRGPRAWVWTHTDSFLAPHRLASSSMPGPRGLCSKQGRGYNLAMSVFTKVAKASRTQAEAPGL